MFQNQKLIGSHTFIIVLAECVLICIVTLMTFHEKSF